MRRAMPTVLFCSLSLLGCKDEQASPNAAGSAASSAAAPSGSAADADLLPAIEVTGPRPRYSLSELTDKQVSAMVKKAGWTPTVVGKTPAAEEQSTIRVGAMRKDGEQRLDTVVIVRCKKPEDKPAQFPDGEAYFRDGSCHMSVAVRLGIRNKSAESKRLLETLLAGSAEG